MIGNLAPTDTGSLTDMRALGRTDCSQEGIAWVFCCLRPRPRRQRCRSPHAAYSPRPLGHLEPVDPAPPCGELNRPDEVRRQTAKLWCDQPAGVACARAERRDMAQRFRSERQWQ